MDLSYKQNFLEAGKIAKKVRLFGKSLIVKGASYNQVITKIHAKIKELGAIAAFPPQIALNEIAAHFLPNPGHDIIFKDDIVKLDVGICYKGAIGDCAVTVDLSGKHEKLILAAESALLNVESSIKVGMPIREIGKIIEDTIMSYGFSPIRNLAGHGLGFNKVHMAPSIPNYDDGSKGVIKAGMTIAVEPFSTNGVGSIDEYGSATIFSFMRDANKGSALALELLKEIKSYNGLPFAIHDLISSSFPLLKVKIGLAELIKLQAIAGYAPLIEEKKGMVAQAENSILIDENGKVFVTTR